MTKQDRTDETGQGRTGRPDTGNETEHTVKQGRHHGVTGGRTLTISS